MDSILFVCLGNICRSPAGEEVLRQLAGRNNLKNLKIESAGLGDWHIGRLPDERMISAAQDRGFSLSSRAQQIKPEFFNKHDLILAMDKEVMNELYKLAKTPQEKAKIHLLTEFSPIYKDQDIPDPYYGNRGDFDFALDIIEDSCQGLIDYLHNS